ncbi:MAG TPA: hypothetical protein VGG63_02580 [Steroidobacteraceae bacterium]|jgi:hypothetical protein
MMLFFHDAGHLAQAIVGEILRVAFLDGLYDEARDEFGFVAVGVTGGGSAGPGGGT